MVSSADTINAPRQIVARHIICIELSAYKFIGGSFAKTPNIPTQIINRPNNVTVDVRFVYVVIVLISDQQNADFPCLLHGILELSELCK